MVENHLDRAPGFVAEFQNVVEHGFFENIEFSCSGWGGNVTNVFIRAVGKIPSSEEYAAEGCGALVDPKDIIEKIKGMLASPERTLRHFSIEVKTEDWVHYGEDDNEEEIVLGSKGTTTKFSLVVHIAQADE